MRAVVLLLALCLAPLAALAEPVVAPRPATNSSTDMGLELGIGPSSTIGFAYTLGPDASLRAGLAFDLAFKPAGASFSLDVGYRHYFSGGTLRPFFQPGISFGYAGLTHFAATAGLGLEYFFTPRVSVAGIAGAALRFDGGGNSIHLALGSTGILATFYF